MSRVRTLSFLLLLIATLTCGACADPPDKEMQQAQGAIDAARAAGADQYAADEFKAAEDALKRAHDAVDDRDYRQALNNALDARERAQNAAKETVNKKATARADAEKALGEANLALNDSRNRLQTADTSKNRGRNIAFARRALQADEATVQEARTAFEKGDYLQSIEKARAASAHLRASARDLESAATSGARKRR